MSVQESLRQAIDRQHQQLRDSVPRDRVAALLALIRAGDRMPASVDVDQPPDLVTGRRLADPGGSKALQLCLEATDVSSETQPGDLDAWAEEFREQCGHLAAAEVVLGHCESGFMRIVESGSGRFDAWIATKREPATWRERADVDWWAASLSNRREQAVQAIPRRPGDDSAYRQIAAVYVESMSWQLMYPPQTVLGGCPVQIYREVAGWLIGKALQARDRAEPVSPWREANLIGAIAADLAIDPDLSARAISALTLDRENAAWHAAVPGIAAAWISDGTLPLPGPRTPATGRAGLSQQRLSPRIGLPAGPLQPLRGQAIRYLCQQDRTSPGRARPSH
jgi:hypothetical protein